MLTRYKQGTDALDNLEFFKQYLLAGAYMPPWQTVDYIAPACSSGDCEFPDFVSLGICSKIRDITSQLNITRLPDRDWHLIGLDDNTTWSVSLPSVFGSPLVVPNLRSFNIYPGGYIRSPDQGLATERNLSVANLLLVYGNAPTAPGANSTFGAMEVLFHLCTRGFSLTVRNGVPRWAEAPGSGAAAVLANTAQAFDLAASAQFQGCMLMRDPREEPCQNVTWGSVTLAPPRGFERHAPITVDESAGLAVSAMLQMSFWNGATTPFWATTAPAKDPDGGMFMVGVTYYRLLGDISLAIGNALFRSVSAPHDPASQLESVGNMSRNMGVAMEN